MLTKMATHRASLQRSKVMTQLVIQERMKIEIVVNEFIEDRDREYMYLNI